MQIGQNSEGFNHWRLRPVDNQRLSVSVPLPSQSRWRNHSGKNSRVANCCRELLQVIREEASIPRHDPPRGADWYLLLTSSFRSLHRQLFKGFWVLLRQCLSSPKPRTKANFIAIRDVLMLTVGMVNARRTGDLINMTQSIKKLKRIGNRGSPCLVPLY